jgi:hypothetical protein
MRERPRGKDPVGFASPAAGNFFSENNTGSRLATGRKYRAFGGHGCKVKVGSGPVNVHDRARYRPPLRTA